MYSDEEIKKGVTLLKTYGVVWIIGQTQAGKTTYSNCLRYYLPEAIPLDGDEVRKIWPDLSLSEDARRVNNEMVSRMAKMFKGFGFRVVISTICPYEDQRKFFEKELNCRFIYVRGGLPVDENHPFETPENPSLTLMGNIIENNKSSDK